LELRKMFFDNADHGALTSIPFVIYAAQPTKIYEFFSFHWKLALHPYEQEENYADMWMYGMTAAKIQNKPSPDETEEVRKAADEKRQVRREIAIFNEARYFSFATIDVETSADYDVILRQMSEKRTKEKEHLTQHPLPPPRASGNSTFGQLRQRKASETTQTASETDTQLTSSASWEIHSEAMRRVADLTIEITRSAKLDRIAREEGQRKRERNEGRKPGPRSRTETPQKK
jgi:hypothetical protein